MLCELYPPQMEKHQVANKHGNRWSNSLAILNIQIKTTITCHILSTRLEQLKYLKISSVGEDMKLKEILYTVYKSKTWHSASFLLLPNK